MISSYGETSGFSPVANDELTSVNGGVALATILGIIGASVGTMVLVTTLVKVTTNGK
jgi:uncharacterized membrane protein YeaQ/YmgE (transglycosylase-associated protein family)